MPRAELMLGIHRGNGFLQVAVVEVDIDTQEKLSAYWHGGEISKGYCEFIAPA